MSIIKQPANKKLDLNKVKQIIFRDIELLLNNLELSFQKKDDNYFMCCPIHEASDNPHGLSISKSKMSWRCWTRGCHEQYNTDILGFIRGVLSKENEVTVYDSLIYENSYRKNVDFIFGDIRDYKKINNIPRSHSGKILYSNLN